MSMRRFLEKIRKQDAVYWERVGVNYDGTEIFDDPIDIKVRWEDVQELFVDEQGEEGRSTSLIMMGFMAKSGSWLKLGKFELSTGELPPTNPRGIEGAWPIRQREAIPDIKNRATLYLAYV